MEPKPVYKMHFVELTECSLKKDPNYFPILPTENEDDDSTSKRTNNLNVDTHYEVNESFISVFVSARVDIKEEDKELLDVYVVMKGLFELLGETDLPADAFGKVNGPAILFPFVREHMASMTLKANIPPILLPPINFVRAAADPKRKG